MRARYYEPASALFLTRDPAVFTTRKPYTYVNGNPLNSTDPMGLFDYTYNFLIGQRSAYGSPQQLMSYFQQHPGDVFPFSTGQCSTIHLGERCDLQDDPFFHDAPVRVTQCDSTSFTFTALPGHFDPPGSTVRFSIFQKGGDIYLQQHGHWTDTGGPFGRIEDEAKAGIAYMTWLHMANKLANENILWEGKSESACQPARRPGMLAW